MQCQFHQAPPSKSLECCPQLSPIVRFKSSRSVIDWFGRPQRANTSTEHALAQVQLHIHARTRNREEAIIDEDADEGCDNNFIIKRTTVQFVNRLTSAKSCTQQQPIQRKRTRGQERCGICGKGDTHVTTKWICCDQCGQWYAYTCLKWGVAVASVAEKCTNMGIVRSAGVNNGVCFLITK